MRSLGFLLLLATCFGAFAAEIESLRLRAEPARTRLVLDLDSAVDYRAFTMANPHRVVIDLHDVKVPSSLKLPDDDQTVVVKGVRFARRNDTGLRVVFDLKNKISLEHTLLAPRQAYGHRLVLDFHDPNRALPLQAEKKQPAQTPPVAEPVAAARTPQPVKLETSTPPAAPVAADRPVSPPSASVKKDTADKPSTKAVARAKPPREVVVAIDAGHGGNDVGAIGAKGTYEKDIVLQIARELAAAINRQHGMRAVLTRNADYYVGLRARMVRARHEQADLFVSIHADAFKDRRVQGSSVYVLSQNGASSEAARWLAENENASDLVGGVTLEDKDDVLKSVLIDLSQTASIDASIDAANQVLRALKRLGKVHKKNVQHAGFMVLKSPDIPSLLIETAFISNPSEEEKLRSRTYQKRLARAMTNGIYNYFQQNPPPETRFAQMRRHRVQRGDTLSQIAERYAVSMESIKFANNMSRNGVRNGEVLTIP